MSIIEVLLLATAVSIDAFGIGCSCTLRGIKTPFVSKLVMLLVNLAVTSLAVFAGSIIKFFISARAADIFGFALLASMGGYIVFSALKSHIGERENETEIQASSEKVLECEKIKSEKAVTPLEAAYISVALSADCFAAGISAGMGGAGVYIPPVFALFQLGFLIAGETAGRLISGSGKIKRGAFELASGVVLIILGFCRLIP